MAKTSFFLHCYYIICSKSMIIQLLRCWYEPLYHYLRSHSNMVIISLQTYQPRVLGNTEESDTMESVIEDDDDPDCLVDILLAKTVLLKAILWMNVSLCIVNINNGFPCFISVHPPKLAMWQTTGNGSFTTSLHMIADE